MSKQPSTITQALLSDSVSYNQIASEVARGVISVGDFIRYQFGHHFLGDFLTLKWHFRGDLRHFTGALWLMRMTSFHIKWRERDGTWFWTWFFYFPMIFPKRYLPKGVGSPNNSKSPDSSRKPIFAWTDTFCTYLQSATSEVISEVI